MELPNAEAVNRKHLQVTLLPAAKSMQKSRKGPLEVVILRVTTMSQFHWIHATVFATQKMYKLDFTALHSVTMVNREMARVWS